LKIVIDFISRTIFTTFRKHLYVYLWWELCIYSVMNSDSRNEILNIVRAEGEFGLKLKALHTDRGGEFTMIEFADYCAAEGVHRQHTAPYSPQQNDIVECQNGMVVATTRSMLKAKGLRG
jgi:transposase InsO family protein